MLEQETVPASSIPQKKRKRGRSPSYPGIGLEGALDRAKVLYEREQMNAAPVSAILDHWGYKPQSGGGMVAVAALKKFGLLEDEGSGAMRKARLTNEARRVITDTRQPSPERDELIRQMALQPRIHADLWNEYDGILPSDATLEFKLINEKNFLPSAAREFIPEFRSTIAYAGLTADDKLPAGNDRSKRTGATPNLTRQPAPPDVQTMQLPIASGKVATLSASFPLSEAEWKQMVAVLDAMKPALVEPPKLPPTDNSEDPDDLQEPL